MPQFEIQDTASDIEVDRVRARTIEEAVRTWLGMSDDSEIVLEKAVEALEALEGWQLIRVSGQLRGRVRPFQRMRFRRA